MGKPVGLLQIASLLLFSQVIVCLDVNSTENGSNSVSNNLDLMALDSAIEYLGGSTNGSVEIMDGVFMSFPASGDGGTIVNFKLGVPGSTRSSQEEMGRDGGGGHGGHGGGHGGKGGKHKNKKLLEKILPLFIMPFLIQSAIIPVFLSVLKMMLLKSFLVGKLALALIAFNALRSSNAFKSRSEETIANGHYGYHGAGMEEYGAYVNRRK